MRIQLGLGDVYLGVEVDVAVLLGLLCGERSTKLLSSRFEFVGSVGCAKLPAHAL